MHYLICVILVDHLIGLALLTRLGDMTLPIGWTTVGDGRSVKGILI